MFYEECCNHKHAGRDRSADIYVTMLFVEKLYSQHVVYCRQYNLFPVGK